MISKWLRYTIEINFSHRNMTWSSVGDYPHPMFGWYGVQKCSPPSQLPVVLTSFGTTSQINFISAQSFLFPSSCCLWGHFPITSSTQTPFFRICFQETQTKTSQIEKWRLWFFSVYFIWCQVYNRLNRNSHTYIYTYAHTCINKYLPL